MLALSALVSSRTVVISTPTAFLAASPPAIRIRIDTARMSSEWQPSTSRMPSSLSAASGSRGLRSSSSVKTLPIVCLLLLCLGGSWFIINDGTEEHAFSLSDTEESVVDHVKVDIDAAAVDEKADIASDNNNSEATVSEATVAPDGSSTVTHSDLSPEAVLSAIAAAEPNPTAPSSQVPEEEKEEKITTMTSSQNQSMSGRTLDSSKSYEPEHGLESFHFTITTWMKGFQGDCASSAHPQPRKRSYRKLLR